MNATQITIQGVSHSLQEVPMEESGVQCDYCSMHDLCYQTMPRIEPCSFLSELVSLENTGKVFNFYRSDSVSEL